MAPDVVLIDLQPGLDVNDLVELSSPGQDERGPALVVLGAVAADARLPAELAGRSWGYLPRDAGGEQIVAAVHAVGAGLIALDPGLSAHLLAHDAAPRPPSSTDGGDELTTRERQVLQLVAEGKSSKEIAAMLKLSIKTVESHRGQIMERLGVHDVTGLVRFAIRVGLVSPDA